MRRPGVARRRDSGDGAHLAPVPLEFALLQNLEREILADPGSGSFLLTNYLVRITGAYESIEPTAALLLC